MYEEDRQQLIGQFRDNYPNLVRADGSYIGWVSSFHGATYDGQPVSWDLDQSRYRFGLYCLASAWSRSGRWEGPVRLLMAMSMEDGDYLEPTYWANGNPNRIAEDFEYLVKRGGAAAQIPRARNASARQDCVASFMTIGREFDFIEETVQRLHGGQGDPGETVRRLRSIIGTGFGNRAWRIKIPLILRELRCAGWDGIPGESCCVPDIRVANTYARYGCFLPGDLLMASAKIYEHFGDLFDLPPFFAPDHDMRVMRTNQGARTTLIDPEILMNRELIEEDNVDKSYDGSSGMSMMDEIFKKFWVCNGLLLTFHTSNFFCHRTKRKKAI
ncbi:MAG: hypothetical protein GY703_11185 [Gammaproteobacteria bacterium]|nr:hypothetical protein [Gammaproteobacteria bacterium]